MKCTCMRTYTHTHSPTLIGGLVFKMCVLKFCELLHDISHLAHSLPCLCRGSCILWCIGLQNKDLLFFSFLSYKELLAGYVQAFAQLFSMFCIRVWLYPVG